MSAIADNNQIEVNFQEIAAKGRELWAALQVHHAFGILVQECGRYSSDWKACRGSMAIPGIDLRTDGEAYVTEGIKSMVLFTVAGGMIPLPSPVDAAMHAATAQLDLCRTLATDIGLVPQHRTLEETTMPAYERGGLTDQLYAAVFGEEPPARFWQSQREVDANFALIAGYLDKMGIDIVAGSVAPDAFERMRNQGLVAA